jgi:aromatic amino acid transport protein AroP
MISWSHLRFRAAKQAAGARTAFPSPLYPLTNWACLLYLAGIVAIMYATPELRVSVWMIPAWLGVLAVGYRVAEGRRARVAGATS